MLAIMVCTSPLNGGINGWLLLLNSLLIAKTQSKVNSQRRFWLHLELLGNNLIPKINMFFNKSKLSVTVILSVDALKRFWAVLEVHGDRLAAPHLPHLLDGKWRRLMFLMLTLWLNITMLCLIWQMGEYLWVTCCGRPHNSRCSGGTWDFLSPSITWNRQAILLQPGAVFPMGAVRIFLAYLTPRFSEIGSPKCLFYIGIQTQQEAIVPEQSSSVLPLRMWHARALWPELNHTAHLKHITGWANISSYWCFESHGHSHYIGLKSQLVRTNPQGFLFSPSRFLGSPSQFVEFLYVPSSRVTTGFKGELIWSRSY